jgi:hypothetical protein
VSNKLRIDPRLRLGISSVTPPIAANTILPPILNYPGPQT